MPLLANMPHCASAQQLKAEQMAKLPVVLIRPEPRPQNIDWLDCQRT